MSVRLGMTGSIGMGKSTTAQMFRDLGVPVWDADATVHRLYAEGGAGVAPIRRLVPSAVKAGHVDRTVLKAEIQADPALLARIEGLIHPLVAQDRVAFLAKNANAPLVVLDIPLLFETGGSANVDAVLVVTTDLETQKKRVLERGTMTEETFAQILARQTPDAEKRQRADYVIETKTLPQTRAAVAALVSQLTAKSEIPHA